MDVWELTLGYFVLLLLSFSRDIRLPRTSVEPSIHMVVYMSMIIRLLLSVCSCRFFLLLVAHALVGCGLI